MHPYSEADILRQNLSQYQQRTEEKMRELVSRISHLEAQQETPASASQPTEAASDPLSAPTTGLAPRRWEWRSAMHDVPSVSLQEDQRRLVLMDETTGFSKSISFTPGEWEAMCNLFLILPPTSELHTTSGGIRDGRHGVAGHEGVKCQ